MLLKMVSPVGLFLGRLRTAATSSVALGLVTVTCALTGAACSTAAPPTEAKVVPPATASVIYPVETSPADDEKRVSAAITEWHDAAAKADGTRFFSRMTDDVVFMGTSSEERLDKAGLQAAVVPIFAKGKGWRFKATRRAVMVAPGGDSAWFDEELVAEELGPVRGSGVLVRTALGWQIAHYVLSVPIPNERFAAVRDLIANGPRNAPNSGGGW